MGLKKYLFIDRDGTLIQEPEDFQVDSLEKLQIVEGVVPALLTLQDHGFHLIMITNQDGLGTDSFPQEDFSPAHNKMLKTFSSQGVQFKEILICPHFETDNCLCRKPHLGLVRELLTHGEIDFERSFVIGDRDTDIQLAENMGLNGILYSESLNLRSMEPQSMGWPQIVEKLTTLPRVAKVTRKTNETQISCSVNLDNNKDILINTGIGFFDHMLEQISKHSGIGLQVQCSGDLIVDQHHSIEDIAIALGQAIKQALGDKIGIARYGFTLPMDEALCQVAMDLSGRAHLEFSWNNKCEKIGELSAEMVPHFFRSLCQSLEATLHIKSKGENSHHIVEGMFKAFAKTLKQAVLQTNSNELPSTKGVL
ncbi:MAG: bifunctional histidinol-phosphatase/imidazoleglycerol-phosphate dehydratase HisB [Bdellovibrionaceae bacterium]|jgi:imidazoleglycerol-phosphate dehydratase / histidinol-phosphatase|nr:bifunctional histidinol-phosphatase/imidazoleglycerol-phosphate dehydratase HisB [Pseudobdellovibrionaceae bacterium]